MVWKKEMVALAAQGEQFRGGIKLFRKKKGENIRTGNPQEELTATRAEMRGKIVQFSKKI